MDTFSADTVLELPLFLYVGTTLKFDSNMDNGDIVFLLLFDALTSTLMMAYTASYGFFMMYAFED